MVMSRKAKNTIFISILFLAAGSILLAFYLYNKGPLDIRHSAGIPVMAEDLYTLYSKDSLVATEKYTNKILEVTGEVMEVSLNTQHQKVILLKTRSPQSSVNCTIEEPLVKIEPSDLVTLKGICNGIG